MKLRIRRSGRHRTEQAADLQEHAAEPSRCLGINSKGGRCKLDAGPNGYCGQFGHGPESAGAAGAVE